MSLNVSDEFLNKYVKTEKKRKKDEEDGLYVSDEFLSKMNTIGDDVDDIAPIPEDVIRKKEEILSFGKRQKEKEEQAAAIAEENKWYNSGLFEDGYDFGDVTKTILGIKDDTASLLDLTWNSAKRGYYNSLYGEELYKDMTGVANTKDAYKQLLESEDYQFAPGNTLAEGVSGAFELIGQMGKQILDPTNAALALGAGGAAFAAGQLGPQVLAPEEVVTIPVAAAAGWASGVAGSTYRVEAGHAYNEMLELGVSKELAQTVATVIGAGNAALEAFQVDELLDAYKILNKSGVAKTALERIGKELLDRGVDIATETAQEVAQEGVTIAGTQIASKLGKGEWAYSAEEVGDRLLDTAKSSALSFGLMNAPAATKNFSAIASDQVKENSVNKKVNALSEDEQTIVNKVTEEKIAKQEEDGNELTERQKTSIKEQTLSDLEKGYISAEKIEEILGGEKYDAFRNANIEFFNSDDYKAYQQAAKEEAKAKEEFNPLVKMVTEKMTGEQIYRRDELKKILDESKVSELESKLSDPAKNVINLRNQMRSEMMERVKDTRLAESYRELERSKQKFTVDINQYKNENAKKTVQSILDSGLGDNTTQFHETVDWLAKISEEKNVTFDLTKTERLKGTKHYKEGYVTNGFKTQNGDLTNITINLDGNYLNTTVGHEITHVLEKAGVYKNLSEAVKAFAIAKEGQAGYNKRLEAIKEIYGEDQATVDSELTADIVGEYLFTDYEFVHSLSTKNRNVFQKIYDEIKYMVKIATAGSKEARELERVKKMFDKAYRENVKGKAESETNVKTDIKNEATIDLENDSDLDYESPTKYSLSVTDPETIDFLENQEHITTYKAMVLIDGKLYPPMASKVKGEDGKYHMTNPRELGEWMKAEEDTTNIKFNDNGVGYYDLKKDDGGTVRAAYNPYEHSSNLVLNDQFEAAYKRDNLVTVECVIPVSEMNGAYKAEHAKDSTGKMDWHSGVVAGKLSDNKRSVYLSRYLKAVRILSDAEVAQKYKEIVGDIAVPFNVVSPGLLTELENVGVNIDYDGSPQYQYLQRRAAEREAKKNAKAIVSESVKTLDGGSVTKYSLSTWTPKTQDSVRDNLLEAGFDSEQVDKWIKDTNSVAAVIASDKARLDFEAADNQVMLKDNQEYIKTLDASTLCAKRLVYQGTFDAIQHRLPNTMLSSDDLIDLLNIMKAHGVQTPCGVCYVESRRRHLGKFAQQWLDSYEGEYKPRLDEVTTSDGLETLRHTHPQAYQDFVDAMSKKGSSNPKVVQLRTEYRNDIMSLTPAQIRKIEAIGGLRVQSFSDFETPHLLDMMQAVMDMSAKGLHSQAYTKVPNFAWVFGDTGIKINLSLIADGNGFDSHGNLAFSSTEGMDIDEAMKLRDAYPKNVGTIIVGANDAHILACMADERIDFIIPFHRSGWGMRELELMGMDSYTDYTYGQKEHDLNKPTKVVNGVQQYAGLENLYPPDYWDYTLSGKENAERYLSLCAKTGREPKFSQFLVNNGDGTYSLQPDGSTDGYWKTLIDFKMYDNDGNGAAQQKVVPNFNMSEAHRVLKEYEGGANKLPVANDVVDEFVAKYTEDVAPTQYSMTKQEKAKMDTDYLDAVANNDEEVMRHLVREYARASMPNSKLVDENGNLREVYHGTNTGDFTVFNPDYIGMSSGDDGFFGMGFYFAYSKGEAAYYGARRIIPAYLDLQNPFNFDKELQTYDGEKARYGHAPDAVALMNFADKFPDIAMSITIGAVKNGESTGKSISVFEFAKAFKDVIENKEFEYQELVNEYGETELLVTADPQIHEYEYNGETRSYRDYGFQKRWLGEANKLDVAYEYLSNAVYSYLDIPRRTNVILDNNREFTDELKRRRYDGAIQSEYGDEAVAFYPSQIKSAELITKDDDGNVIPLSERFDRSNDDIRYSMTKVNELEKAYQYDLDNEDMLGAEMIVEEMANLAMPDSKIRGEDGRLIPVYHGTNADFWEFDTSADGGKNGTAEGFGIYLSDDTEVTEIYGDRQIKMFANITKPATSFNKTINKSTLIKLIKDTCNKQAQKMVDEEGYDSLQDALRDTWISNYVMTYDMSMEQAYREVATSFLQQNDNDKDLIHEVMFGMAIRNYDQAMDFYRNSLTPVTGIDGFITKWTNSSTGKTSNIYLAFDSSQLKSADAVTKDDAGNVIPLAERFDFDKKDIRYSISKEGEERNTYGNWHIDGREFGKNDPLAEFAPVREDVAPAQKAVAYNPKATVSNTESVAPSDDWQEAFNAITDDDAPPVREDAPVKEISTVAERIKAKIDNAQAELDKNRQLREQSFKDYDEEIASLQAEYEAKKNKNSLVAQGVLRRIERLKRLQADNNANYEKRISDLEARVEKLHSEEYSRAEHRRAKQDEYTTMWEDMIGNTSTWKDMPIGLQYKTKTLRRILRKVVKDDFGNPDFRKADEIYDELETKYDHNEALLKKESARMKEVFQKLKLNQYEDTYAHMAGEFRHNPQTELTADMVKEYYDKHKKHIDIDKVNTAIKESRKTFDELIGRVNKVLKEQGFKEIPYRQGYFPHFTNPKQNWLQKLLNWKPVDTEIPTSIAGLTETFKPQRSWQKFDKQRKGDKTDYSLYQGLDTYIHGALDWIYHIEDLQKRRALENHIRYVHSDEGVKQRIKAIKAENYDADEAQQMIDGVLKEAQNPLSGLVRELMNRTNTLANKKSSMDRGMEDATNRKIYSTMTNLNNRINANMVVGSFSSALTNFIPMVQSWHQVSPVYTVRGLGDFVRSVVKDDGVVAKSDYLTNRLLDEEKLYKTGWDKVSDKAAFMMNAIDNITSQTVWRSKYLQNIHEGMSESAAIKDADQFSKNLMAGRSRGNAPTIFDAKNPLIKIATAFQLEVANQYGYMFEDVPQDSTSKARLVKGYATAFLGAYVYNALYSSLVGRDAAFDPIGIIEDLLSGLFDDDEEPEEVLMDFGKNIIEEVPFVGGLIGGGRIPLSSALPYSSDSTPFQSMLTDVTEGKWDSFGKEFLKPLYYLAMPIGGGQLKKTVEGLSMFSDDHPVSGSYTDSGKLRFPVEDTFINKAQAALFGQYASKNARDYFDNERSPLGEKQIQEYMDVDLPIGEYWNYRDGLKGLSTLAEKADYINSLDLETWQKNLLINNIADRKEDINMESYGEYGDFEEFDYAQKNPEKYKFITEDLGVPYKSYSNGSSYKEACDWAFKNQDAYTVSKAVSDDLLEYYEILKKINRIKDNNDSDSGTKDKDLVSEYINSLSMDYGRKIILYRSLYSSKADKSYYDAHIVEYLNERDDISKAEMITILKKLGFTVSSDGNSVSW